MAVKDLFRKKSQEDVDRESAEAKNEYMLDPNAEVDPEEVLRKHDRESKNRKLTGTWWYIVAVVSCIYIGYHVITARFGTPVVMKHRAIHLGFILFLVWCYFPALKSSRRDRPTVPDVGLMGLTVLTTVYYVMSYSAFIARVSRAVTMDYFMGAILIVLVLEACRRIVGKGLLILSLISITYVLTGHLLTGVFSHRGYNVQRMIYQMYLSGNGIFGQALGVSAGYLVIFIVLGAILDASGLAKLFNDLALSVAGRLVGGPAKVSVIASALMGSISGSAATNVATTGAFTIPLMKKIGYKPYFAGAIEAAASTGGQIMPPVMGTVAFIMAEYLGVRYSTIALAAIIPAFLYFAGVYFQIDFRARKVGLRGLSDDEMPDVRDTVKNYGHMILPLFVLVAFLVWGYTPVYAAFYAILITWVLALFRKSTRIGVTKLRDVAIASAKSSLSVGVAMASAGFIVGALSMTGIGVILADNIVLLSRGILFIALVLTMIVSIILGMGLPTSACYIIAASIAVPILTKMGVPAFQAHFFVLYFSIISTVTPPVALASYVGAGMAGADPNKVGYAAFKLALAAFIIPYFFVYNPAMLLIADSSFEIVMAAITAIVGTYLLAAGLEGYLFAAISWWERIIVFAAAINLMAPGTYTDAIGAALAAVVLISVYFRRKSSRAA